jgi:polyribonucleotide nucleotidyltransferase
VGQVGDTFLVNPNQEKPTNSPLELIVSGSEEKITMLEAKAQELSENKLSQAIAFAQQEIRLLIGFFRQMAKNFRGEKKQIAPKKVKENNSTDT